MAKKRRPTLKMKQTALAYLSRDKSTFGNMAASVQKGYGTFKKDTAATYGATLMKNATFRNYLEELAEEMGIGVKVRLQTAAAVATGRTRTTHIKRVYKREDGKMVLVRREELEHEPSASERIRALRAIDKTTGHDETVKRDNAEAMQLLTEMRDSMLSRDAIREIDAAIEGNDE